MKGKAKWLLLIISMLVLLVVPLSGCFLFERLTHPPALNTYEAIVIIQIAGVPYIDEYFKKTVGEEEAQSFGEIGKVTAFGDWDADYKGKGKWVVSGKVRSDKWGECLTTWTIQEKTNEIKLTAFNCD